MKWTMLIATAATVVITGCATTLTSVPLSKTACKDAGKDCIPYYLPRPYLLLTKNFAVGGSVKKTETSKQTELAKTTENSSETVTASVTVPATNADVIAWQIVYLPDLDQKYGLRFKRGWGKYETKVSLVDGWQLAGINFEGDAQAADTIKAIGSAVKDAASAIPWFLNVGSATKMEAPSRMAETNLPPRTANAEFWLFDLGDLDMAHPVFHWTN